MCAINGYTNNIVTDPSLIHKMNQANKFRGPDSTDVWQNQNVTFGHNLLAINAPVEESRQPRVSRKGNVLAYNGEIYGTDSLDTEHLLNMLDFQGIDYLKNVNGQFALAWYNAEKNQLTIARDHYGGKPLFYIQKDNGVVFSSTLHALNIYQRFEIDQRVYDGVQFLDRFYTAEMTLYVGVKKLVPGEYITFDAESGRVVSSGSLHDYQLENRDISDSETKRTITDCLYDSIRNPNRTAVMLSGGLDSNTILHHCSEVLEDVVSVSCKYEEAQRSDVEQRYVVDSNNTSLCSSFFTVPHYVSRVCPTDLYSYSEDILSALHMPAFDRFRLSPRFFSILKAKEAGAKVVLSGDGGDEIFTGYSGDRAYFSKEGIESVKYTIDLYKERFKNLPFHVMGDDYINNHRFMQMITRDTFSFVNDGFAGWHSMEQRFPFYHQKLVRTLLQIPGHKKLRKVPNVTAPRWVHKYYLRELFKEELPHCVTYSEIKAGFAAPWGSRDENKNKRIFDGMVKQTLGIINK